MTNDELDRLRELAEKAIELAVAAEDELLMPEELCNFAQVDRQHYEALSALQDAANPSAIIALVDEVRRLRAKEPK